MASQLDFPFPEIRLAPSRKSRVCWDGHGQPWFGLRVGLLRDSTPAVVYGVVTAAVYNVFGRDTRYSVCLLYTSPSPRDVHKSRMPSSA